MRNSKIALLKSWGKEQAGQLESCGNLGGFDTEQDAKLLLRLLESPHLPHEEAQVEPGVDVVGVQIQHLSILLGRFFEPAGADECEGQPGAHGNLAGPVFQALLQRGDGVFKELHVHKSQAESRLRG